MGSFVTCSLCKLKMRPLRVRHQIYFLCDACQGIGVSFPVLKSYLGVKFSRRIWAESVPGPESHFSCPCCQKPMKKNPETGQPGYRICTSCRFLFFTSQEKEALPADFQRQTSHGLATALNKQERMDFAMAMSDIDAKKSSPEMGVLHPEDVLWGELGLPLNRGIGSDTPLTRINQLIAGLIIILSVLNISMPDIALSYKYFGIDTADWFHNGGLSLLTGAFAHASLLHMAVNLFFLSRFSFKVETWLGRCQYLVMLAIAEIVGKIFLMASGSEQIYVGSGAMISALTTVFAMNGGYRKISLYSRLLRKNFAVSVFGLIPLVPILNQMGTEVFVFSDEMSSMSWWPFAGGILTGFIFWAMNHVREESPDQTVIIDTKI